MVPAPMPVWESRQRSCARLVTVAPRFGNPDVRMFSPAPKRVVFPPAGRPAVPLPPARDPSPAGGALPLRPPPMNYRLFCWRSHVNNSSAPPSGSSDSRPGQPRDASRLLSLFDQPARCK